MPAFVLLWLAPGRSGFLSSGQRTTASPSPFENHSARCSFCAFFFLFVCLFATFACFLCALPAHLLFTHACAGLVWLWVVQRHPLVCSCLCDEGGLHPCEGCCLDCAAIERENKEHCLRTIALLPSRPLVGSCLLACLPACLSACACVAVSCPLHQCQSLCLSPCLTCVGASAPEDHLAKSGLASGLHLPEANLWEALPPCTSLSPPSLSCGLPLAWNAFALFVRAPPSPLPPSQQIPRLPSGNLEHAHARRRGVMTSP